ncbi:hypothetical protein BN000_00606 [Mycobacterium europaeum]|uniref:Uncharacterized protein n=1 Tax=Mycobacterium europaeum TaxID=761804 RepID=A0A0U1CYV5_9MYCO|nr:hypothetical protein [Mycobacterium europaeum]CQD03628.1 hypothetical protein BN000_00606 [Mycobacterium europaeum]
MSSTIVTGPKKILQKWRDRREPPLLQLEPGPTDDDIEFGNDVDYFRGLLDAIHTNRIYGRGTVAPFPTIMSTTLDIALFLVRKDFPDTVAAELAQWRADIAAAAA